jgi:hypothetical protein
MIVVLLGKLSLDGLERARSSTGGCLTGQTAP